MCFIFIANTTKIIIAIPPTTQPIVRFVIGEDSGVLGDHVGELLILEGEIAFGSIDDDAASVELRED